MHFFRHPVAITFFALVAACSGRDKSSAQAVGDTIGAARRVAVIALPTVPYRVTANGSAGQITGTVNFDGTPPSDSIIVVPADQNGCGKPLTIRRLERSGGKVAGVLVWLTDVREGRSLPTERRFELENNDCAWSTTVQAAIAGGALNVANYDPLVERAFITDVATSDTVAVAPFTDDGQVIPYDRLLRHPGLYEFSIESRPMSRAWVAVLDVPYFAITDSKGSFTIDGVPPGTHHIRAWHPMLGIADGVATVSANGRTTITIKFP